MDKKFNSPNPNEDWRKNYRELQPAKLWGANFEVDDQVDFKEALVQAVKQTSKNLFGYFIHFPNGTTYYHLSRYPRRKYGPIPDDEEIRGQLKAILNTSNQNGSEETIAPQSKFRIVLGLEQGYGSGKFYSIDDIISCVGNKFDLTPVEIFTVKTQSETYQEPAVKIEGELSEIQEVYALAEKLKQERFAVDDFSNMTSHIVETRLCSSHDV